MATQQRRPTSSRPTSRGNRNELRIPLPPTTDPTPARVRPTREQIAQRAYELFEAGGRRHGSDRQDWLRAERELMLGL